MSPWRPAESRPRRGASPRKRRRPSWTLCRSDQRRGYRRCFVLRMCFVDGVFFVGFVSCDDGPLDRYTGPFA